MSSGSSQTRFQVPPGATAQVRIIDTTSRISMLEPKFLLNPGIKGLQYLPTLPAWSFLIENGSGRRTLFDLGIPTDWTQTSPAVADRLKDLGWEIEAPKSVAQILSENDVSLDSIESMTWSHYHWDHIGNPEQFPSKTDLIVGPGFKEAQFPGYPAKQDSNVRESDFKGRNLREITFEEEGVIQIGQFRALDYFGDGSYYLLDTPGHCIGHIAGLIRTTSNPDTFIFTGGDLTHHGCEIRPSKYLPLPKEVPAFVLGSPCPGEVFEKINKKNNRAPDEPLCIPSIGNSIEEAVRTIQKAQDADADENVLYLMAHDATLWGVVDFFPQLANDWKKKGWRDQLLWAFLRDLKGELE